MPDSILARIKKLLKTATWPGGNEGEKENAMRLVFKLLDEHNLSMSDVEGFDDKGRQSAYEFTQEMVFQDVELQKWEKMLGNAVGTLTGTEGFWAGESTTIFVGHRPDVALAVGIYNHLREVAISCCLNDVGEKTEHYFNGFVEMIAIRAHQYRIQAQQSDRGEGDGRLNNLPAVIEAKDEWLAESIEALGHTIETHRVKPAERNSLYHYGARRGSEVPFSGIGGS